MRRAGLLSGAHCGGSHPLSRCCRPRVPGLLAGPLAWVRCRHTGQDRLFGEVLHATSAPHQPRPRICKREGRVPLKWGATASQIQNQTAASCGWPHGRGWLPLRMPTELALLPTPNTRAADRANRDSSRRLDLCAPIHEQARLGSTPAPWVMRPWLGWERARFAAGQRAFQNGYKGATLPRHGPARS